MPTLDEIKVQGRRRIHGLAAVACDLVDSAHPNGMQYADDYTGPRLTVRYHNKLVQTGDLDGAYGQVIDGIDRLVFSDENLSAVNVALADNAEVPLVLARGSVVTIPSYKSLRFTLDAREPSDGPLESVWAVARQRG